MTYYHSIRFPGYTVNQLVRGGPKGAPPELSKSVRPPVQTKKHNTTQHNYISAVKCLACSYRRERQQISHLKNTASSISTLRNMNWLLTAMVLLQRAIAGLSFSVLANQPQKAPAAHVGRSNAPNKESYRELLNIGGADSVEPIRELMRRNVIG